MIKLHCFGESGNAYKAALTLELSEAEWELAAWKQAQAWAHKQQIYK